MNALSKLRLDHWGWLNMQVALILWGAMFVINPSPILVEGMGERLTVITGWFTIIGGILAIIGLLNSNSFITKKSTRALGIEGVGLIFSTCGPLIYAIVYASSDAESISKLNVFLFAYTLTSALVARTIVVLRAFARRTR